MSKREWLASGAKLAPVVIVLAIVAIIPALKVAVRAYFQVGAAAKEARLHHDLAVMRELIERFRLDRGRYPSARGELVEAGYLRAVPIDVFTESDGTWVEIRACAAFDPARDQLVVDVRSGAPGKDREGIPYADY